MVYRTTYTPCRQGSAASFALCLLAAAIPTPVSEKHDVLSHHRAEAQITPQSPQSGCGVGSRVLESARERFEASFSPLSRGVVCVAEEEGCPEKRWHLFQSPESGCGVCSAAKQQDIVQHAKEFQSPESGCGVCSIPCHSC